MQLFTFAHECRHGEFLVPKTDAYVGDALIRYGEYSEHELTLLLQLLGTGGGRVIAVGANLGALVVPLAQKAGEVIAIEPQRWVFGLLCANVVLNDLINVRPYWAAAGSQPGTLNVPVLDPAVKNNFGALSLEEVQGYDGDKVPVLVLDDLPDLEGTRLITIDVEGAELDVLMGAEQTITRERPFIFVEADRPGKRAALFAWLRAHEYDLYWYRTPLFNEDNHRGVKDNVYVSSDRKAIIVAENVFAAPRELALVLDGFAPVEDDA